MVSLSKHVFYAAQDSVGCLDLVSQNSLVATRTTLQCTGYLFCFAVAHVGKKPQMYITEVVNSFG